MVPHCLSWWHDNLYQCNVMEFLMFLHKHFTTQVSTQPWCIPVRTENPWCYRLTLLSLSKRTELCKTLSRHLCVFVHIISIYCELLKGDVISLDLALEHSQQRAGMCGAWENLFDVDDNDKWHFNLPKEQIKFQKS